MVPIELVRRYPFFAGFDRDQVADLARVAEEISVQPGHEFIHEGDHISTFFLVLEGKVGITLNVTDRGMKQSLTRQITNNLITKDVTVSTVGVGEMFGWSALVPPNLSTANAKALTPCRVMVFDYHMLQPFIDEDCCFGHMLTLKAARVIRERMRDQRMEMLVEAVV
jgi:CRP-like cAMP-binding protein